MKFEDLTGKKFNSLLVVKLDKIENDVTFWLCLCDCGKYKSIRSGNLKNGNTKSCHGGKLIDITGETFGNLTVIERASDYISPTGKPSSQWVVRCICGKKLIVRTAHLKTGHTVSCHKNTESYIVRFLKNYFKENFNARIEYRILKNPKTKMWLPYDIYIPYGEDFDLNGFYIEVHGEQHYKYIKYFHKTISKFENQKERDSLKRSFAKKNGIYIEVDLRKTKTFKEAIEFIKGKINNVKKKKNR